MACLRHPVARDLLLLNNSAPLDAGRKEDMDVPTDVLLLATWPAAAALFLSVSTSILVFPFFTYVPTSGYLGDLLPQVWRCLPIADVLLQIDTSLGFFYLQKRSQGRQLQLLQGVEWLEGTAVVIAEVLLLFRGCSTSF